MHISAKPGCEAAHCNISITQIRVERCNVDALSQFVPHQPKANERLNLRNLKGSPFDVKR